MTVSFKPIQPAFVAIVENVDLREDVSPQVVQELEDGFAKFGVLIFRAQRVGDYEQERFIEKFGPPSSNARKSVLHTNHPHMLDIATQDTDGKPIDITSPRGMFLKANELWHTDGTTVQPPTRLTSLHARILPPIAPPTQYADMGAAWDALSSARQARLEGLSVEHDVFWSRSQMGFPKASFSGSQMAERQPVHHPLVRANWRTGRKSLYLASHGSHIVGWPLEEGRALLKELMELATQPQFVYTHHWELNELVMWDDSWTMHRATPYDGPHPRLMRWAGVEEWAPV